MRDTRNDINPLVDPNFKEAPFIEAPLKNAGEARKVNGEFVFCTAPLGTIKFTKKQPVVWSTAAQVAERVKAARGAITVMRVFNYGDVGYMAYEMRQLGMRAIQEGSLLLMWDPAFEEPITPSVKPLTKREADQVGRMEAIKDWIAINPEVRGRVDLTAAEVAKAVFGWEGEASQHILSQMGRALRALGYTHIVTGEGRLNAWRPPRVWPPAQKP